MAFRHIFIHDHIFRKHLCGLGWGGLQVRACGCRGGNLSRAGLFHSGEVDFRQVEKPQDQVPRRVSHRKVRAFHRELLHRFRHCGAGCAHCCRPVCCRCGDVRPDQGAGGEHFGFNRLAGRCCGRVSEHLVGPAHSGHDCPGLHCGWRFSRGSDDGCHSVRGPACRGRVHDTALVQRRGRCGQLHRWSFTHTGILLWHVGHVFSGMACPVGVPQCGDDRWGLAVRAAVYQRSDQEGCPQKHLSDRCAVSAHPYNMVFAYNGIPCDGARARSGCGSRHHDFQR